MRYALSCALPRRQRCRASPAGQRRFRLRDHGASDPQVEEFTSAINPPRIARLLWPRTEHSRPVFVMSSSSLLRRSPGTSNNLGCHSVIVTSGSAPPNFAIAWPFWHGRIHALNGNRAFTRRLCAVPLVRRQQRSNHMGGDQQQLALAVNHGGEDIESVQISCLQGLASRGKAVD